MAFRLPPLNAVRLFEAAARSLSFKEAAKELHVTPSAVSHGVQTLERWLGAKLFVRTPRNLSLTPTGERFLLPVQQAFEALSSATERVPGRKAAGTLSVSVPPTFGSRWLIPRLPNFTARYPDIVVVIDTDRRQIDLPSSGIDLAIRMAPEPRPGGTWLRLVRECFVPVCSPAFLAKFPKTPVRRILETATLIHVTTVSEDWDWWFGGKSAKPVKIRRSIKFDTARMAIDAAVQGLGIALGRKPLVDEEIASGQLVEIDGPPRRGSTCYWLVGEEETFKRAEIRLFRSWLLEEMGAGRAPRNTTPNAEG